MLLRVLCGLFGFVALVASACDSRPAYPLDDDVPTDGGRDDAVEDASSERSVSASALAEDATSE